MQRQEWQQDWGQNQSPVGWLGEGEEVTTRARWPRVEVRRFNEGKEAELFQFKIKENIKVRRANRMGNEREALESKGREQGRQLRERPETGKIISERKYSIKQNKFSSF